MTETAYLLGLRLFISGLRLFISGLRLFIPGLRLLGVEHIIQYLGVAIAFSIIAHLLSRHKLGFHIHCMYVYFSKEQIS